MNPKQASRVVQKILKVEKYLEDVGLTVEEIMSRDNISIRAIYNKMRSDYPKTHWRRLICNNQSSPRWSFILYMAVQNRLYTRDRLIKWGSKVVQYAPCVSKTKKALNTYSLSAMWQLKYGSKF